MRPLQARIGIVAWNTARLLDRCLASLPAATDGLDCEVTVHDNASTDDTVDVVRSHPGVRLSAGTANIGYAAAMNVALEPGRPVDVLIALNPDTECPPGSLTRLAQALVAEEGVGLVAPRLVYPNGRHQPSTYRFPSPAVSAAASVVPARWQRGRLGARFGLEAAEPPDRPVDIDWAVGAVHVIRPAAVEGRKVYDERWFMYSEDLDLCWRLAGNGWRRRLRPEISVVHAGNAAGAQAWGPERTSVWLAATYDWYELRHGPAATRAWAATNLAGASLRRLQAGARRATGRTIHDWQRELAPAARLHARALLRGGTGLGRPGLNGAGAASRRGSGR